MFDINLFLDEFRKWLFLKHFNSYSKTSVDYYIRYTKALYRKGILFTYTEDLRNELWGISRQMRSAYMRSRNRVKDFVIAEYKYLVDIGFDEDKLMILGDMHDGSN